MPKFNRVHYYENFPAEWDDHAHDQSYHQEMRLLHNRGLHTWGVIFGLNVQKENNEDVKITPGLAMDNSGQELELEAPELLELAELADGHHFVTISYDETYEPEDEDLPTFIHRVIEGNKIELISASEIAEHIGKKIILARVLLKEGKIERLDDGEAPHVRRMSGATGYGYFDRVGVGTMEPGASLHLNGPLNNTPEANPTFKMTSAPGTGTTMTMGLRYKDQDNAWINGYGSLVLQPDGGNVGIGTTAPRAKLHVDGDIWTGADDSEAKGVIAHGKDGGFVQTKFGGNFGVRLKAIGNSTGALQWYQDSDWHDGITLKRGNVGIGTTAPKEKLTIVDNAPKQPAVFIDQNHAEGWGLRVATSASGTTPIFQAEAPQNKVRMSVNANGNVGIGVTEPNHRLHVRRLDKKEEVAHFESDGNLRVQLKGGEKLHQFFRFYETKHGRWEVGNSSQAGNKFYFNPKVAHGVSGSAVVIQQDGNVGIGMHEPQAQLIVGAHFGASISGSSSGRGVFGSNLAVMQSGENRHKLFTPYTHDKDYGYSGMVSQWGRIDFFAQGGNTKSGEVVAPAARMVIQKDGNVGIGTYTPGAKLDIEGNAFLGYEHSISDFGAPLKSGFYQSHNQKEPGDVPDNSHEWSHLITARHSNIENNHQLQIAASYAVNDRLFFRKVAAKKESSNPAWHEVATRGANSFSGNQSFHDNVAIGKAGKGASLSVAQGKINDMSIILNGTGNKWNMGLVAQLSSGGYNPISLNGNTGIIFSNGKPDSKTDFVIAPWSNTKSGLKISSDGKVGIGTSTPGATLDVSGSGASQCCAPVPPTISLAEDSIRVNRQAWLQFHNHGEAEAYIRLAGGGEAGSGREGQRRIEIGDNQGAKASLTVTGSIGIGTTAPEARLHVESNRADIRIRNTNKDEYAFLSIQGPKGQKGNYWDIAQKGDYHLLEFRPRGGAPRMVIRQDGNVGVGTITPGAVLDVSGSGASQCCAPVKPTMSLAEDSGGVNRQAWLQFHNTGESEAYIRLAGGGKAGSGREGQRRIEIGDNQGAKAGLTVTGNVGIGTTAPATKLHVQNDAAGVFLTTDSPKDAGWNAIRYHVGGDWKFDNGTTAHGNQWYVWSSKSELALTIDHASGNTGFGGGPNDFKLNIGKTGGQKALHIASDFGLRGDDRLNLIKFGTDGDYQFLHKAKGAMGRNTLAMHVWDQDAFGVYSTGWKPLLEVAGGSGDTYCVGRIGTNGYKPDAGYPSGWGGGVHTWDVYAEGSIACGVGGGISAFMNRDGHAAFTKVMHGSKPVVGYLEDGKPIYAKRLSGTFPWIDLGVDPKLTIAHGISKAHSDKRIFSVIPNLFISDRTIFRERNDIYTIRWNDSNIELISNWRFSGQAVYVTILYS